MAAGKGAFVEREPAMKFLGDLRDRVFNVEVRHSPKLVIVLAVLGIVLVDALDFSLGAEVHLSVLLLIPIYFTVWYVDFRGGVFLSFLSSIYLMVDYRAHPKYYHHFWVAAWNLGVLLVFFLVFCWVLDLLKQELKRAHRGAKTDGLTGLLNPRGFYEAVEREWSRSGRHGHPLTLLFFDLDNFKPVNDHYGHSRGDNLLQEIALILDRGVREGDSVARMGGDEFAILFPETGPEAVRDLAEKIHGAVEREDREAGITLTASIGVATFLVMPERFEEIVRAADLLMYEAKRAGKNKILFRVIDSGVAQ